MVYPVIQDVFPKNWTKHEASGQVMVPAVMKKNRYLASNEKMSLSRQNRSQISLSLYNDF